VRAGLLGPIRGYRSSNAVRNPSLRTLPTSGSGSVFCSDPSARASAEEPEPGRPSPMRQRPPLPLERLSQSLNRVAAAVNPLKPPRAGSPPESAGRLQYEYP
jgi:hypothetical protein